MGREAVSLMITVKKQSLEEFIEAWNEFLKKNEYLNEDYLLNADAFEENGVDPDEVTYMEDEICNLFDMPNDTGLMDFCESMIREHPGVEFDIEYSLDWDNCADCLIESYYVAGNRIDYDILEGEYFCSEDDYDEMQDEIDEEDEDSVELVDDVYYIVSRHEKGTKYV